MDAATHALLLKIDLSGAAEFSWQNTRDHLAEIKLLVPAIEALVGCSLDLAGDVQDASFLADVGLLDERCYDRKSRVGEVSYVFSFRFSHFGRLFTLHGSECDERFSEFQLDRVLDLLRENEFVYVPASELSAPYDGVDGPTTELDGSTRTWWHRFFDYT